MQSIRDRKASLLWLKWIETKGVEKLKKKQYSRAEEGEGKCCFCHLDQYAASQYFPVRMQPALQLILAS